MRLSFNTRKFLAEIYFLGVLPQYLWKKLDGGGIDTVSVGHQLFLFFTGKYDITGNSAT